MANTLRNDRIYTDPKLVGDTGSIIIVVATDAPLLPHQLKRIAKRAGMGLARMGSYAGNGSGDIFVAFSTANAEPFKAGKIGQANYIGNDDIDGLFEATVQATEEAIVNAMVAARDMQGEAGITPRRFRTRTWFDCSSASSAIENSAGSKGELLKHSLMA